MYLCVCVVFFPNLQSALEKNLQYYKNENNCSYSRLLQVRKVCDLHCVCVCFFLAVLNIVYEFKST
jgi:hypothetical protein